MTIPAQSSLDELYAQVTAAILRAESAEAAGEESRAADAYFDVSCLEESIADVVAVGEPEGQIARRGVLRAALRARQYARAMELAERYLVEPNASAELMASLGDFRDEARRALDEASRVQVEVVPEARFRFHDAAA
ncbi:MAG: hypothetical protein JWO86_1326 [Myxococcaceae bacterium]|nr:hypothetical protein [Myxococcaceae bacterium]